MRSLIRIPTLCKFDSAVEKGTEDNFIPNYLAIRATGYSRRERNLLDCGKRSIRSFRREEAYKRESKGYRVGIAI